MWLDSEEAAAVYRHSESYAAGQGLDCWIVLVHIVCRFLRGLDVARNSHGWNEEFASSYPYSVSDMINLVGPVAAYRLLGSCRRFETFSTM